MSRCVEYCRKNGIAFGVTVVPDRSQRFARESRQRYQHRLERITAELRIPLIDPDERFLSRGDEPLYWPEDAHLAPAGHELLAEILAEHLARWARSQ
jgi:hypothetical protein